MRALLGRRRPARATGLASLGGILPLLLAIAGPGACPVEAIIPELSGEDVKKAVDEGTRAIAQEDFGEEWRVRLPRGEEVQLMTPYSRVVLAARHAAFKEEPLTPKQLQDQIDRGKGKLQVLITMFGREIDFARWYQAVLRVGDLEVKATFTQNERTAIRTQDGRFAARNVYVFPLEGLPARGGVTLVISHSIEKKEVLRAALDLSKMR
jgi:hypothetical protein